jgi:ribosome-binding protein aMBF1 (putative translation factor)
MCSFVLLSQARDNRMFTSTTEQANMPTRRKTILIPVNVGEHYQDGLIRRLDEEGILRKDLAAEIGVDPTQLSRWLVRPSPSTGRNISIGIDNVQKIEEALIRLRAKRAKAALAEIEQEE